MISKNAQNFSHNISNSSTLDLDLISLKNNFHIDFDSEGYNKQIKFQTDPRLRL